MLSAVAQIGFFLAAGAAFIEWIALLLAKKEHDSKEYAANFGIWAGGALVRFFITNSLQLAILSAVAAIAPFALPVTWWSVLLALLVADFIYYWKHRIEHESRFFWTYHAVHHSSPRYNLSTAIRLPWIGSFLSAFFLVPMALVGFPPTIIIASYMFVLLYQFWIHTEKIGKLGFLENILNTPSHHRVHHGSNKQYHDKNYAGILIIWDKLFGSFVPEEEKVVYGITNPINSYNLVHINFRDLGLLFKDMKNAESIGDSFKYFFKAPGWQPAVQEISLPIFKKTS